MFQDYTMHLFGLTFFLEIPCFLLQDKLLIPGNWWEWEASFLVLAKLKQHKIN